LAESTITAPPWHAFDSPRRLEDVVGQLTRAANFTLRRTPLTVTTDGAGTWTTLYTTSVAPTSAAWFIECKAIGMSSDGVKVAAFTVSAAYRRGTGATTLVQIGADTILNWFETHPTTNVRTTTSADKILVQARDDGATVMTYKTMVDLSFFEP
jgi:hypothetical protein